MSERHLLAYRNLPGLHCGSTAMRNLLWHYAKLELSEEEVFGLGSGIDLMVIEIEQFSPSTFVFGRGVTLEVDVAASLGLDYRETPVPDADEAWRVVRDEVLAGRPTMLSGDALYLDYRASRVHFPAHRFVLVGFDDDERAAFLADRIDPEPQRCSYAALAKSRNPPDFISTYNLWGKFHSTEPRRSVEEAYESALTKSAARMLGDDMSQAALLGGLAQVMGGRGLRVTTGLAAIDRLGELLPLWLAEPGRDFQLRYAAQSLEAFGNGGGNFRRLFTGFLAEVRTRRPDIVPVDSPQWAADSAQAWTRLSAGLEALGKDAGELRACLRALGEIRDLETRLFEGLAAAKE